MLTTDDLLRAVLLPLVVALAIGLVARWRRWGWAMPLTVGIAFACGWVAFRGMPSLPPRDGTDWLFWIASADAIIAAILVAVVERQPAWAVVLGVAGLAVAAGLAFAGVAWPLVNAGALSGGWVLGAGLAIAAWALLLSGAARIVAVRIDAMTLLGILAIATAAAGVVVLSSHLRVVGVYGLTAAAAVGGTALPLARLREGISPFAATATTLCGAALLSGVLAGGHYYPTPGVSWVHVAALLATPLLAAIGASLPTKRKWLRSAVAIVVVGAAAAAIAAPLAIKAKKTAEEDPYAAYGSG